MTTQNYPTYEVEDIDPVRAEEILSRNTHNRTVRGRVVRAYAEDMRNGAWQENGESIKLAVDGTVVDGQHRLHAIVESETKHRVLVVRGLPMETQETVDGGAKRKFSDVLKLREEPRYVALASVTRRCLLWDQGYRGRESHRTPPTVAQMLAFIEAHPEVRRSTEVAASVSAHAPLSASIVGLCHWLFEDLDFEDAEFFFGRIKDGVGLTERDPVYVLRRTLANARTDRSRLLENQATAFVIKAWNAYREGRQIQFLAFRPGGANPEKFPEPK